MNGDRLEVHIRGQNENVVPPVCQLPTDSISGRARCQDLPQAETDRPVRIEWRPAEGDDPERLGLHLAVLNRTPNTIHDFRLYLTDLRKYDTVSKHYVEV